MTKEHKTHEEIIAQHQLEQSEVTEVLKFLKKYGNYIGYTVAGLIVIFAITSILNTQAAKKDAKAGQMLMAAHSDEELQVITDQYANTSAAPGALLALARSSYNKGNYEKAQATYNSFLTKYSKHDMVAVAAYGQAACLEALNNTSAAIAEYQKVADQYQSSFIAPVALANKNKLLAKQDNAE